MVNWPPPQLVASPDVPVPFAPELEACYRPGTEAIRRAIDAMLGAERTTESV